jgi:hypothetical protein
MRRLAAAILAQAAADFLNFRDLYVWRDAEQFLYPQKEAALKHFRWTLECSAVNPFWLHRHLVRARSRITPPADGRTCRSCGIAQPASTLYYHLDVRGRLANVCKKCGEERRLRRLAMRAAS